MEMMEQPKRSHRIDEHPWCDPHEGDDVFGEGTTNRIAIFCLKCRTRYASTQCEWCDEEFWQSVDGAKLRYCGDVCKGTAAKQRAAEGGARHRKGS